MSAVPVIVPISDLRRDAASVVRLATASGEPVYVTQRGRAVAVMISRLSFERLSRELEILSRAAVGDLAVPAAEGLTVDQILMFGEQALAEERRLAADERAAAERRLANDERAAMRPDNTPTLEEFLAAEGLGDLVSGSEYGSAHVAVDDTACDRPSAWYRGARDE